MSESFPYTASVGKLKDLMSRIRKDDVPKEVNRNWFKDIGFTKKDDSDMLQVLRFIGFVDEARKPTPVWNGYQSSKKHRMILADAIKMSYHKLFSEYPAANEKNKTVIVDYFRKYSSLEDEEANEAGRTFLNLCSLANFNNLTKEILSPKSRIVTIDETRKQIESLSIRQEELFKQSKQCIENKIYGAAHVVAWIGFMDYLGDQLTDYGIKKIIAKKENLSKLNVETIDDLREIVTDHAIIIMLREIKIFSKLEMTSIHGLLSKRNECAHPTNYRPGLSETLGYVNELLKRIKEIESKKPK